MIPGMGNMAKQIGDMDLENSKVDLSRRALFYELGSLFFREFLGIRFGIELDSYTLEEFLTNHQELLFAIAKQFRPLEYFIYYKQYGVYPFFTGVSWVIIYDSIKL